MGICAEHIAQIEAEKAHLLATFWQTFRRSPESARLRMLQRWRVALVGRPPQASELQAELRRNVSAGIAA